MEEKTGPFIMWRQGRFSFSKENLLMNTHIAAIYILSPSILAEGGNCPIIVTQE
jgi:hypothetical protein